jgi:hypothetical protein
MLGARLNEQVSGEVAIVPCEVFRASSETELSMEKDALQG